MDRIAREKQDVVERCVLCGKCLTNCRVRPHASYADKDPAELQKARVDFLKGGDFSQEVYDTAFSCTGCHYCTQFCEQGLDPSRTGTLIRSELVDRGHAAPAMYSFILPGERFSYFNIMSALLLDPSQTRWVDEVPEAPGHVDVVYFPGCGMHATPDRLFSSMDILDQVGMSHITLGGISHCCGSPSMGAGRSAEAAEYGNQLLQSISAFTPKTAVTYCPGCTMGLTKSAAAAEASFKPMHMARFLAANLDQITFDIPIDKTVTIHDPCHLGRGLGEYEGARKVLEAIPGIKIVEMEHSGKNTLCCGSGASMTEPDAATAIGVGLLDEAKATGADILLDFCHGCDSAFKKHGKDEPFEIVNFLTLVGRAMGIEYEDKLSLYMEWRDVDRVIEDARANIEASSYSEQEIRSFLEMFFAVA
jgi:Fe-S oxidoreductase